MDHDSRSGDAPTRGLRWIVAHKPRRRIGTAEGVSRPVTSHSIPTARFHLKDVECVGEIFDQIFGPDDSVWMKEFHAVGFERVGHDDETEGIAVGQVVVEPVGGVDVD